MNNAVYAVKIKNASGECKRFTMEDRNAISVINRLILDPSVTEILSVKPFTAFDELCRIG